MRSTDAITAVVLAAGKGTRMKSHKAKVLHEVFYQPMLHHVLDALQDTAVRHQVVIIGHQHQEVARSLQRHPVSLVLQEEQLGTGHAVLCAEKACADADLVMILCGDTPLIRAETLQAMISHHRESGAVLSVMTTLLDNPFGYGRILSDAQGGIIGIIEQKDATAEEQRIREINAGIYLVERDFLFRTLRTIGTDNSQGEVYLTDIVGSATNQGLAVSKYFHDNAIDVLGVNSRWELAQAHQELQQRRNRQLMLAGVTIYQPGTVFIAPEVSIGIDTIIHPSVHITGSSRIGAGCVLEPGVCLHNCQLADQVRVGVHAILENCEVATGEQIAPQTLRQG